jgi:hypothetical protein
VNGEQRSTSRTPRRSPGAAVRWSRMPYGDDLLALSARRDALAGEVAATTRKLEEVRGELDEATGRAHLPVLDNLRVASPCTAEWNQMTGDDRVRHCGQCAKNVYNLSGMTRDEAEALLRERNGDLCVRYYERQDGTILLADCTVGRGNRSHHRWIAAGAAGLISAGLAAAVVANHLGHVDRVDDAHVVQVPGFEPPPPPEPWTLHQPPPRHIKLETVRVRQGLPRRVVDVKAPRE